MSFVARVIARRFQGLLFLGALAALWGGVSGVWHGLRHPEPTPVDLVASPKHEIPDHVALQNISLSFDEAVLEHRAGESNLYIPVRPKGATQNAPVRVVLKSANRDLLETLPKNNGKDGASTVVATIPLLIKLRRQSEATGMVAGTFDVTSRQEYDLRRLIPMLERDFKIVVEGEKPSLRRALGYLGLAVGLLFVLGMVSQAGDGGAKDSPPPLATVPPPLPPTA